MLAFGPLQEVDAVLELRKIEWAVGKNDLDALVDWIRAGRATLLHLLAKQQSV